MKEPINLLTQYLFDYLTEGFTVLPLNGKKSGVIVLEINHKENYTEKVRRLLEVQKN